MHSTLALTLAVFLAACAHDRAAERWTDTTGAQRSESDFARDRQRCALMHGPTGVDMRERLRPDDCSTARSAAASCIQSDNARRTAGDGDDACLHAAGWARDSGSILRN